MEPARKQVGGYYQFGDEILNWLNSLDTEGMKAEDVRSALCHKVLSMRPRKEPTVFHDEIEVESGGRVRITVEPHGSKAARMEVRVPSFSPFGKDTVLALILNQRQRAALSAALGGPNA